MPSNGPRKQTGILPITAVSRNVPHAESHTVTYCRVTHMHGHTLQSHTHARSLTPRCVGATEAIGCATWGGAAAAPPNNRQTVTIIQSFAAPTSRNRVATGSYMHARNPQSLMCNMACSMAHPNPNGILIPTQTLPLAQMNDVEKSPPHLSRQITPMRSSSHFDDQQINEADTPVVIRTLSHLVLVFPGTWGVDALLTLDKNLRAKHTPN